MDLESQRRAGTDQAHAESASASQSAGLQECRPPVSGTSPGRVPQRLRSPSPQAIATNAGEARADRSPPKTQHLPDAKRRRRFSPNGAGGGIDNSSANLQSTSRRSEPIDEAVRLFDFAEELRQESPPGEPWFMEMTRLRRLHFLWLNRELAALRKKILEDRRASDTDMKQLQALLRDQCECTVPL